MQRRARLAQSASACVLGLSLALAGCNATSTSATAVNKALTRPAGEPGAGQQRFDSDNDAAAALLAAVRARDKVGMDHIFGPSAKEFVTGDKVEDEKSFDNFVKNATEHLELEKKDANTSYIDIGNNKWPFPIPLTRLPNGKWFFDTEAGKQEILDRRIGANELETIKICRAYVEAQREYASQDRDGNGVLQYAQHFRSHSGKHDGLYWDAAPGEPESPLGQLMAEAAMDGYDTGPKKEHTGPQPFHGYFYHILTCQGPAAPGGKYSYIINGNMFAGFALVSCPSAYGSSGVMTFIISHNGKLYQKDLGPHTADIVHHMKEYNPDSSWTLVAN